MSEPTPALFCRALEEGRGPATAEMVRQLAPIIQVNVGRVLLRRAVECAGRDLRQEVEDLTQEVFEWLLADGGRRIRHWDDALGSASTYFGVVARRYTHNKLDSRKQNPWTETPHEPSLLDSRVGADDGLERLVASRELLGIVMEAMRRQLGERDIALFEMLFVEHRDDREIQEALGMKRDALYQARHRLQERVKALAAAVLGGDGAVRGG